MRDKLDFVKIKNVCIKGRYEESAKINYRWEKISANHRSDRG